MKRVKSIAVDQWRSYRVNCARGQAMILVSLVHVRNWRKKTEKVLVLLFVKFTDLT